MVNTVNQTFIMENDAIKILEEYAIPYPEYRVAHNLMEIKDAAKQLGYPLVMKVLSPQIVHKSDYGGVIVGINNINEVIGAYHQILDNVKAKGVKEIFGILVCKQAADGMELIIGGIYDEIFGPVLMFGMGGIFVEVLKDTSFRVCPIDEFEAMEMISGVKSFSLLAGIRGKSGIDLKSLANMLVIVSRIMIDHPEIREIDLNPIRGYEKSLMCLDARIAIVG